MKLNLKALLTLNVENQLAVTHFKKDTFTLYEYALIFGSAHLLKRASVSPINVITTINVILTINVIKN